MKRDPSIHITYSQFEEFLELLGVPYFPTEAFFKISKKRALNSRVVLSKNNKTNKKIKQITLASYGDAQLFADLLYAVRIKLKHRGVRKITLANTKEWSYCKRLAEVANIFCQDFGFPPREGFIKFIELGISKCKNDRRSLTQKLLNISDSILEDYGDELELKEYLKNSNNREEVQKIHDYYIKYIASSTGIYEPIENNPSKMLHLCRVHTLLKEHNWDHKGYITAQFEALSFCNGIPSVDQLYGDKAIERFNKYKYKRVGHPQEEEPSTGSLWDRIKNK